ncbi:MAG: aspartyl protease family protein [Verrucomicrobiota bacterium]
MGLIRTEATFWNPKLPDLEAVTTKALVDTGVRHLCVTQELADQLELKELRKQSVETADGVTHTVPYVGPIQLEVCGRECFTGALVIGTEVLLGSVPMEDMDLWTSSARHQILPNPLSPDIPLSVAKGHRVL